MYSPSFDYHQPKTLSEAISLLLQHKDARILAGGHSLLPAMKLGLSSPSALVDISRIKDLAGIKASKTTITIGALTTHASIAASEEIRAGCPILAEAAAQIGDLQVRNRGTIGGSLAHGDPAADFPTVVVALGAKLVATGAPRFRREIPAGKFFTDLFTTALKPAEVLTEIRVPVLQAGTGGAYLKHRHPASSYAVVGVAALVTLEEGKCAEVRLVVGGVTPNPVHVAAVEEALRGQVPAEAAIASAAEKMAEAIPNPMGDDVYASGEYRVHLAKVMAGRALIKAVERAKG